MNDSAALSPLEMERRFKLLHYRVQSQRLAEVWRQFETAGFKPILIKGWAAAQFYPQPHERSYTDIDLVFSADEYQKAEVFVRSNPPSSAVDLHLEARHLDSVPFADLFENSVSVDCEGVLVRSPRAEDHLRILCVHWLNDGGADKSRLRDITYALENRPENFDWDRFLGVVCAKRRRWIICALGLAHKFDGLSLADTPVREEAAALPKWLIRAVEKEWESGVRLIPLQHVRHDRKALWQQIKKRVPPNPIQATIEMDGDFDKYPRFFYQVGDIFLRLPASAKKFLKR